MKEVILTGIKPTNDIHIGNYLGAIKPAIKFVKENPNTDFYYFIADYHALTSMRDPESFNHYVYSVAATWLACGLDPKRCVIYRQSDIPEVFELNWLLACMTPKGDMNRAHSYKAILQTNQENKRDLDYGVNMGLYSYPILMAADILLFDTHKVPVGKDQIQHIEIARSIAQRINEVYKDDIFREPQEFINEKTGYIPGLDGRKMSKSYDNGIPLFSTEKKLKKLINKIKTDSTDAEAPKDPDSSLVMDFYKLFARAEAISDLEKRLRKGLGWGYAKQELFEVMNKEIAPQREKYDALMDDKSKIDQILTDGASKARLVAREVLDRVKSKMCHY
ncbi:tryptophan--tRNA ligase [Bacteriovoracaceae bacterium]|nr:tryptophan--tRNA ligase [Bacteriovoracaceae bacterium]